MKNEFMAPMYQTTEWHGVNYEVRFTSNGAIISDAVMPSLFRNGIPVSKEAEAFDEQYFAYAPAEVLMTYSDTELEEWVIANILA